MKISVIIPVLNEATHIKELLFHLLKNSNQNNLIEYLVIDGGSTDGTIEIVRKIDNVRLISSSKGRGLQMNCGANQSVGDILYFLHADSYPPKHFDKYIRKAILNGDKAGCFQLKFDSNHPWLQLAGWFTQFNVKFFRGGDQSLFIEKGMFYELGKYPENHFIFEDFSLIRSLYKRGAFIVIRKKIISSSRRYYDNGIAKLQYHYWMLYLKKWLGASTEHLERYYYKKIK